MRRILLHVLLAGTIFSQPVIVGFGKEVTRGDQARALLAEGLPK